MIFRQHIYHQQQSFKESHDLNLTSSLVRVSQYISFTEVSIASRASNTLSDIVSVVELSDIPLADVEFCPPSHGDPVPYKPWQFHVSGRVRSWLEVGNLPSSTPNPLPPIMNIEHEFRHVWEHNVRRLGDSPPLTQSTPYPPCQAMVGVQWQHNVRTTSTQLSNMATASCCLGSVS